MAARVTQVAIESLIRNEPTVRTTQIAIETLIANATQQYPDTTLMWVGEPEGEYVDLVLFDPNLFDPDLFD